MAITNFITLLWTLKWSIRMKRFYKMYSILYTELELCANIPPYILWPVCLSTVLTFKFLFVLKFLHYANEDFIQTCFTSLDKLGNLFAMMIPETPERTNFLTTALKWSSKYMSDSIAFGHPRLHQSVALTLWKGNFISFTCFLSILH